MDLSINSLLVAGCLEGDIVELFEQVLHVSGLFEAFEATKNA